MTKKTSDAIVTRPFAFLAAIKKTIDPKAASRWTFGTKENQVTPKTSNTSKLTPSPALIVIHRLKRIKVACISCVPHARKNFVGYAWKRLWVTGMPKMRQETTWNAKE